jgi:hypothetical protein
MHVCSMRLRRRVGAQFTIGTIAEVERASACLGLVEGGQKANELFDRKIFPLHPCRINHRPVNFRQ